MRVDTKGKKGVIYSVCSVGGCTDRQSAEREKKIHM